MTFKQLAQKIQTLSAEQQNMDVTVSCDISAEAFPVKDLYVINENDYLADILDPTHPVLTIDF